MIEIPNNDNKNKYQLKQYDDIAAINGLIVLFVIVILIYLL